MNRDMLTLGPVPFNWEPERWRDFYAAVADEAPVDIVFLGEIVCSKRAPFFDPLVPEVVERLTAAGKQVVLSTPVLVTTERERRAVEALIDTGLPLEANDLGAVSQLAGRPHLIGPFVNVYNEATLVWLAGRGATAVSLGAELPAASVRALAAEAQHLGVAVEVQVFGRAPLAISARCYHARAHGLHKDGCQFVCGQDPDGMAVRTLDDQPFLTVNGTQTMSHTYLCLAREMAELRAMGVGRFRLSPQAVDMPAVARAFRALLDGEREAAEVAAELARLSGEVPLANGFFHDRAGAEMVA